MSGVRQGSMTDRTCVRFLVSHEMFCSLKCRVIQNRT